MTKRSKLEEKFVKLWNKHYPNIPLDDEVAIIPNRKFRFDFVHHESKVAIEINGAIWVKGGHSSGKGISRDYEKLNLALLNGYKVFQLSGNMINERNIIEIAEFIIREADLNVKQTETAIEEKSTAVEKREIDLSCPF